MLWLTVALGTLGLALGLFEIPSYKLTALSGKCTGTLAGPLYIIKCEVPTQADEKCCGYSAVNRIVYPRSAFPTSFSMRCEHPSAIISCYVFYTEAAADAWAIGASPLPANGSYVAGCTAARDCRINGTFRTVAEATPTLAISIRSSFSAPQITFGEFCPVLSTSPRELCSVLSFPLTISLR